MEQAVVRDWKLTQHDPLALRLAADVRFGPTDYADDQIWELTLAGGEPAAVALRTTYGLRAREMRLFPSFLEGETLVADPDHFSSPPVLHHFAVNRIHYSFSPLGGVHVQAACWVPDSHSLAGQFTITNESTAARAIHLNLNAILRPLDAPTGVNMGHAKLGPLHFLQGQTGGLTPVILLEGGLPLDSGAALARSLDLVPGETQTVRWAQTAPPRETGGGGRGLELCRALLERNWVDDFARIDSLNDDIPDIHTGDREWDAALAFGYKVALQSYVGPTSHLPYPSFIFARNINKGYSPRGDGSDHSWQWDGQVATEAYVNLPQIAQAAPELAKGILRNYLAVQEPDGFIDWKPGLAGQRNRALCVPLLATIAWTIYEYTEDHDFIAEVYDGLRRFVMTWFQERYDRDQDGLPEWSHTIQSAFDDCPSFVRWQNWGQAADITLAESPDLAAYLYRECRSLINMASLLGREEDSPPLIARAEMIRIAVDAMWRDETSSYHYVDIETHESPPGYELARLERRIDNSPFIVNINRKFSPMARLLVRVVGDRDATLPQISVAIHGRGQRGRRRVELLPARRLTWYWGLGSVTSDKLYAEVEKVELAGVPPGWEVVISTVDYTRQDQTLLLPIWAGLAQGDHLYDLTHKTITDPARYWRPYGIPNCSALDPAYKSDNRGGSGGVWMMWNTMIGEGLADNGYRAEAAELIRRMMTAMIHTLKTEKAFREAYNSDALEGLGERDYLWGVAPVHLFLRTLGVRIISSRKVWLVGQNPFPWPVTVRWRGVTVTKIDEGALVKFPSGREVAVTEDREQIIEDV
ncbi:MAG: hypothetical protein HYZ49_07735 [Chloroflexi bacterium]|nr:hypothetical protein [Chloroflexota bacterium]